MQYIIYTSVQQRDLIAILLIHTFYLLGFCPVNIQSLKYYFKAIYEHFF